MNTQSCNLGWMKPGADGQARIEAVQDCLIHTENILREILPDGREKSLALTKLEELGMWSTKAICIATAEPTK